VCGLLALYPLSRRVGGQATVGETLIDIQEGQPVDAKTGGNIIDMCPVGALTGQVSRFNYRPWQIQRTPTICPHFSTGDNIRIDTRTHKIRRIVGRENMQVNDQWIADKTRFAYEWVNSDQRLKQPMIRRNDQLVPASWNEALQYVAEQLQRVKSAHGASAIGGIGSTKLSNESNYLLQRFMRTVVGTNNVDHRNGGDVAAWPTGMPALADVMKPQYGPDPKVDTVLLMGLDPSEELPILNVHLKRAILRGGLKLIIAHPRQIELTQYDGPYLSYRPGTEATLLNGLMKAVLSQEGQSGDGVPAMVSEIAAEVTDEQLAAIGADVEAVQAAAQMLAASENALILYGPQAAQGENGEFVRNGLSNLAQVTGHYDGLGYLGLDANSQGCRDMGLVPDMLPGHVAVADNEAQRHFEKLWGTPLPDALGGTYKEMLDNEDSGIKALYLMGSDPASERPAWAEQLEALDFLVVQDLFLTETAQKADVILPAVSWAECDGTFTNVERRVQRAPKALTDPDSKAAPDWMILDHLASMMGHKWSYENAQSITSEISQVVPIYNGLDWAALGDQGLQWDGNLARPEADYLPVEQLPVDEAEADALALVTGTVTYDDGTMFALTEVMHRMRFGAHVGLNPVDIERLNLADGQSVGVSSSQGNLNLQVKVSEQVRAGTAWIPESLPGAPVGTLLNGSDVEFVKVMAG